MINKALVLEVIEAVENTDANFLGSGDPVRENGCLCAIGAWAYEDNYIFAGAVDSIRKDGVSDDILRLINRTAYDAFEKDLHSDDYTTSEVYQKNDRAFESFDTPEARKAGVIAALKTIVA